jgi:hypothetical protein
VDFITNQLGAGETQKTKGFDKGAPGSKNEGLRKFLRALDERSRFEK